MSCASESTSGFLYFFTIAFKNVARLAEREKYLVKNVIRADVLFEKYSHSRVRVSLKIFRLKLAQIYFFCVVALLTQIATN